MVSGAAGTPGLRVEETWDSLGMRATGSHDLGWRKFTCPRTPCWSRARTGPAPAPRVAAPRARRLPGRGPGRPGFRRTVRGGAAHQVNPPGHPEPTSRLADGPTCSGLSARWTSALLPARHLLMGLARQLGPRPDWRPAPGGRGRRVQPFVVQTALGVVDRAMRVSRRRQPLPVASPVSVLPGCVGRPAQPAHSGRRGHQRARPVSANPAAGGSRREHAPKDRPPAVEASPVAPTIRHGIGGGAHPL